MVTRVRFREGLRDDQRAAAVVVACRYTDPLVIDGWLRLRLLILLSYRGARAAQSRWCYM